MARIVVASYQNELRNLLKAGITGTTVEVAYNIVEASAFFHPSDTNILIFDLDSGSGATRYLERLTAEYNLLVILTGSSTARAMDFIRKGFGEFIIKPADYTDDKYINEYVTSIVQRIKDVIAQRAKGANRPQQNTSRYSASAINREQSRFSNQDKDIVIVIASSTGGTEALPKILTKLPEDMPPILVVQHFPPNFARFFCQRVDKLCKMRVKVVDNYETVQKGTVYMADGDSHLIVKRNAMGQLILEKVGGARVNGVIPSADVLFNSVAEVMKDKAIGLVMTGMGSDGAKGLYAMKLMGARTLAQNEETSIIFGMAKVSKNIGAVDELLALEDIAGRLIALTK